VDEISTALELFAFHKADEPQETMNAAPGSLLVSRAPRPQALSSTMLLKQAQMQTSLLISISAQKFEQRRETCFMKLLNTPIYLIAKAIFCWIVCAACCNPASAETSSKSLWVIPFREQQKDEMVLAQTLEGLCSRQSPRIWLDGGGMGAVILRQLEQDGWQLHRIDNVWQLPDEIWQSYPKYISYRDGDSSINIATSLSGAYNAPALAEALKAQAKDKGLQELFCATGRDTLQTLRANRKLFSNTIAIDQASEKPAFLRDFASANNAFYFSAGKDDRLRGEVAKLLSPGTTFYGWGPDEYRWISVFSHFGSQGAASDYCLNLSNLSKLPARIPRPNTAAPSAPPREGERVVAFVLSDGDNLQWLTGNMAFDPKFFGNPHRGEFVMNWGISPLLADSAPLVLKYFYDNAKSSDYFFAMGNPGYRYIHDEPEPKGALDARQARSLLDKCYLRTMAVINTNEGNLTETAPLLALNELDGLAYFSFAPYNRLQGQVFFSRATKKPVVAAKFMLWDGVSGASIDEVANAIARMPASPQHNIDSYAIVLVHAWSFSKVGGPIEAVRQTIARLPAGTRVVSLGDFFSFLRTNFATK